MQLVERPPLLQTCLLLCRRAFTPTPSASPLSRWSVFFTSLRQSVSSWQRRHWLNFLREYRFWFTPTLLSRWGVYTHSFSVGFDLAKTTFAQFTEGFIKKFLLAWQGLRIQIFFCPDPDPTRDILQIMLNTVFYKLTLGHEKINQIN